MQNVSSSQPRTIDARLSDVGFHRHQRSERFFTASDLWYFRTREGKDIGPFRYRSEAEAMLNLFVQDNIRVQQEAMMPQKLHFRTAAIIGRRQAS